MSSIPVGAALPTQEGVTAADSAQQRARSASHEPPFEALFDPRGVAYIGVPRRGRTLGGLALKFGMERPGSATISAVHPDLAEVQGAPAHRNVKDVPGPVDVAFVAVPAERAPEVIADCGVKGVRFAIVGSSGFAESGNVGAAAEKRLLEAAREGGVRLIGPNCNGIWSVPDRLSIGFNTTHGQELRPGSISVVGQTGAVLGSFLAGVDAMGGGIAQAVSTGNEADVDAAECFLNIAGMPSTRVIVLLLDSITRPDIFEEAAAQARARHIPVVAYRFGRSAQGRHAAELHSSRVAGGGRAFSAWLQALSIAEAPNLETAMFAATLLEAGHAAGHVGAISTSGAGAAMMADLAESAGVALPTFSPETHDRLSRLYELSQPFNPLDLAGQANDPVWLEATMAAVFEDRAIDTVVLLSTLLPSKELGVAPVVSAFTKVAGRHPSTACAYAVGPLAEEHRRDLIDAGIPLADSGATLFAALETLQRVRDLSMSSPAASAIKDSVGLAIDFGSIPGGSLVLHDEVQDRLEPLGIKFTEMLTVATPAEAGQRFDEFGGRPVAIKLLDRAVPHKADAGGVVLGVTDGKSAEETATRLMVGAVSPDARILLQPMTECPVEIFVGTVCDPVAGPVVVVGRGGSDVENSPDVRVRVAPVTHEAATGMVRDVSSVMEGLRTLSRLSHLDLDECVRRIADTVVTAADVAAVNSASILSIDLNPLVVATDGTIAALDARIQLCP